MKISLAQIKDIFKVLRDVDKSKIKDADGRLDVTELITLVEDSLVNEMCVIITGEKKDYTEDVFGEEGAIEVIGFFLANILDKLKRSTGLKSLLEKSLGIKMDTILERMTQTK